jgi:Zn-dependent protease with chaperone function
MNLIKPFIVCWGLILTGLVIYAQNNSADFLPAREDSVILARLFDGYQQHYRERVGQLQSKYRKDYLEVYEERWGNIKEKFDRQEIYTPVFAQQYLDALVAEIKKANPMLRDLVFHCYFSRSVVPNAEYIGEGIILFNMGLFQRMDNESEVAYVLGHEIAHCLLHHQENSIDKYVGAINSEEVQTGLRKIKGSEYRKREQLQKLVKGLSFDSRRHSRDHEAQADSMAVELVSNTRLDPAGALSTLALLDKIDSSTLNTAFCLRQLFDFPDYPFRKKWIAREEGLLGGHARLSGDVLEDSLKTHPDCQARIRLLTPMINRKVAAGSLKFVVDARKFADLQRIFRYEIIEYAYLSKEYTSSLYYTMDLLQRYPGDAYLVAQVGRLMNGFYAAQKEHRLSKVAALPSPDYSPNYNLLLQFVQNLYLEEIASISHHYLGQYHPQLDHYVLFKKAYEQSMLIDR